VDAAAIAGALREIASYFDVEGDRFRARAYERAARAIALAPDVDGLVREGRLRELPGIGPSLARVIEEISRTGSVGLLTRLRARWPGIIVPLSQLPHVGPEKARRIHEALAPASLEALAAMCEEGRLRRVRGFGKLSEVRLLEAIRRRKASADDGGLLLHHVARDVTAMLVAHVAGAREAMRVAACGPPRRWMEVADRLAIAVATHDPDAVRARLRSHPLVLSLAPSERDPARIAIAALATGVPCELHTAPADRFGQAVVRATGSAAHVAALAERARASAGDLDAIAAADEPALYAALGLPFVPPEVRDGSDEIAAAEGGDDYRDLVTVADVRGAVHCHTTYSDGKHTVADMARAAEERGFEFLTITDHSQSASYAGGLTIERLEEQAREIAEAQRGTSVRLLRGTESDILADGALDYPDPVLEQLDVVIASIHQRHRLDEDGMTRRLVAAIRKPVFKIWGHPLGRLLLHREPIACRFDEVLEAIRESPVAVEVNGDPHRLDLDPQRARRARAAGARFVLSTDAHSMRQLDHVEAAVGIARRARIRKHEVLNAATAEEFARSIAPHPHTRLRSGSRGG